MTDEHTITSDAGTVTLTPGVLSSVVTAAAESVDGARVRRPKRGLDVEVDGGRARVELELAVRYGAIVPDVAVSVQERVHEALRSMCGLETTSVDISVEEIE